MALSFFSSLEREETSIVVLRWERAHPTRACTNTVRVSRGKGDGKIMLVPVRWHLMLIGYSNASIIWGK
ncbi:hypothetical protein KSF_085640 [Reticulibacter mediterranei]|uniref:Uncharacterized protein n=1 Tax=Reticulibacter mediterranei TaxID=2778369 RepID=A0A8J3IPS9_9CHLR|nr:hypothetical protein KSF_085640 [Reticulibacter mediterranei]